MTETHKMQIILPYGGTKGNKSMTKLKKQLKKSLQNNIKMIVTYQSEKLSTTFQVKGKSNFCHKNIIMVNALMKIVGTIIYGK